MMDEYGEKNRSVRVDKDLAIAYHKALKDLGELIGAPAGDNVHQIARYPDVLRVEEVATDIGALWPKLQEALEAGAQSVLLDNFTPDRMREAVRLTAGRALLEASGGIGFEGLRTIAATGVDRISIGKLTKDVVATDYSLRVVAG